MFIRKSQNLMNNPLNLSASRWKTISRVFYELNSGFKYLLHHLTEFQLMIQTLLIGHDDQVRQTLYETLIKRRHTVTVADP